MVSSLSYFANNLSEGIYKFKCKYGHNDKICKTSKIKYKINTYKFSNHHNNNFISLLRKGVYPYEYMDHWEKLNQTSLPKKEDFHCLLNMEDITNADCAHAKRVCNDFEMKNLGEDYNLYVQSDILLLADVIYGVEIYELVPTKFLSALG